MTTAERRMQSRSVSYRLGHSGEMKGVGFDLGNELARRLAVPFQPVLYPSVGALLDGGNAGEGM